MRNQRKSNRIERIVSEVSKDGKKSDEEKQKAEEAKKKRYEMVIKIRHKKKLNFNPQTQTQFFPLKSLTGFASRPWEVLQELLWKDIVQSKIRCIIYPHEHTYDACNYYDKPKVS